MVLSVIMTASSPAFFGISKSVKNPNSLDLFMMIVLGTISTYGLYAGIATLQIIKNKVRFLI